MFAALARFYFTELCFFCVCKIARELHTQDAWVRVILEKPFGKDEMDAVSLASEMKKIFKEDQMYRVDHYLGKVSAQICCGAR